MPTKGKSSQDPVCGMDAEGNVTAEHNGKTYHFCSTECRDEFKNDPETYANK